MNWPIGPYSLWSKILIFLGIKEQKIFTGMKAEIKINGKVVGYCSEVTWNSKNNNIEFETHVLGVYKPKDSE